MPVKMRNISQIKANLGIEPNGRVQKFFTHTCRKHMDKYVPMDKGDLRTIIDEQPNKIIYEMPYASYQYHGQREDETHKINPENYTTPGTGPYWDRRMVSAEMDSVIKETKKYMRGRK